MQLTLRVLSVFVLEVGVFDVRNACIWGAPEILTFVCTRVLTVILLASISAVIGLRFSEFDGLILRILWVVSNLWH